VEGVANVNGGVDIDAIHAASKVVQVELGVLKIDRSYQRDPSQSLVDKIADKWNEVASELLLVSDRGDRENGHDGGMFVVNGQHRSLAARKVGVTKVWARVIDLRNYPDPAAIEATFRLQTNVRMSDKPLERFKAQLRAHDPESMAIQKILAEYDTEVNQVPNQDYGINAVAAVERLYRVDEGLLLKDMLQLLRDTYGVIGGKSTTSALMIGYAWFIVKHAEESSRSRVVEKLNEAGPAALDRRARTIGATLPGSLWVQYYRAIVDFYNERLQEKSKLEWRLRGAGSFGPRGWGRGGEQSGG